VILRNLESARPWQHVLESLGAYMLLAERLFDGPVAYAEAWNFGPNKVDTRPAGWVVDLLASYCKEDASAGTLFGPLSILLKTLQIGTCPIKTNRICRLFHCSKYSNIKHSGSKGRGLILLI
jgi:hypothetical protein